MQSAKLYMNKLKSFIVSQLAQLAQLAGKMTNPAKFNKLSIGQTSQTNKLKLYEIKRQINITREIHTSNCCIPNAELWPKSSGVRCNACTCRATKQLISAVFYSNWFCWMHVWAFLNLSSVMGHRLPAG